MLTPFQFAVMTVAEARTLMDFIEKATATKAFPRNYDKMQKMGILQIYYNLRSFLEECEHYERQLRDLDTSQFERF